MSAGNVLSCFRSVVNLTFTFLLFTCSVSAQTDTLKNDSTRVIDSLTRLPARDTLSERLRAKVREQLSLASLDQERIPSARQMTHDSLRSWFSTAAPNLPILGRARFPNGSDELAWLHPLVLQQPWRRGPMRTTASVAGQAGNLFSTVYEDLRLAPYEHTPEPNGATDLLALPDMMGESQAILSAGLSQQFGGDGLLTSLLMSDTGKIGVPRTTLLHDRGTYEYSYTRARYHNRFRGGREIGLGLGYRLATDPNVFSRYDQYHYSGMITQPLGRNWEFHASADLNDLVAPIFSQPEIGLAVVRRELQQRQLHAGLYQTSQRDSATTTRGLTLDYSKQHSHADGALTNRFDQWEYRFGYQQQRWKGKWGSSFGVGIISDEFRSGVDVHQRSSYELTGQLLHRATHSIAGLSGSILWPDDRQPLPNLSLAYGLPGMEWSLWGGIAHESRAPKLTELFLPSRSASVVPSVQSYVDKGNTELGAEQATSLSVSVHHQSEKFNVSLLALAGYRDKGIIWDATIDAATASYQPVNDHRSFAALGVVGSYELLEGGSLFGSLGGWTTGGDESHDLPSYQWTLGADLELPWRSRRITLRGSSELRYIDAWRGDYGDVLGGKVESYSTLSLVMGSFEFHWLITNGLNAATRSRDFTPQPDRLDRFGFVWNFYD